MSDAQPAPAWLLLPLPANADHDAKLLATVEKHCAKLPAEFAQLRRALGSVRALASYEPVANRANALVWERFEALLAAPDGTARLALARYAREHMPSRALARVLRRLAKDPNMTVRSQIARLIKRAKIQEVVLPAKKDGDWNATGWLLTDTQSKITRHKTGTRVLERTGVPPLADLAQLRKLLNIKSPKQLGFFLLASDFKNGPYTTHAIP